MILNKLAPFYTAEDKEYINERLEIIAENNDRIAEVISKGEKGLSTQELFNTSADIVYLYDIQQKAVKENAERRYIVEQRYIASFYDDNIQGVLADVAEILDAVEKYNYTEYNELQKKVDEYYASLVSNADGKKRHLTAHPRGYKNCVEFLCKITGTQRIALYYIHERITGEHIDIDAEELPPVEGIAELDALIDAKAQSFYKKPDGEPAKPKRLKAELAEHYQVPEEKKIFRLPTSPVITLIEEAFIHGSDLKELAERKKSFNHSASYELQMKKDARRLTSTTDKGTVTLEISDIHKVTGLNKPAKKLFTYALIKANEQAIFDGKMGRNYISFSLQELVELGMYKNERTARQGFIAGTDALTDLKIKGKLQKNKKSTATIDALEVIFTGSNIKDNQCTIYLNERINWGFIFQYFTIMPRETLKLSNRAFDLCIYIFNRARQSKESIYNKGYFTISFRAIQERLALPSEIGNRKPQQQIKQPIDDAIQNIEETLQTTDIEILPVVNEDAPIKEWLDNGYLRITLKGDYAKEYIELFKNQQKIIESKQKRKDRITEKAIALKMANSEKLNGGESETTS